MEVGKQGEPGPRVDLGQSGKGMVDVVQEAGVGPRRVVESYDVERVGVGEESRRDLGRKEALKLILAVKHDGLVE